MIPLVIGEMEGCVGKGEKLLLASEVEGELAGEPSSEFSSEDGSKVVAADAVLRGVSKMNTREERILCTMSMFCS